MPISARGTTSVSSFRLIAASCIGLMAGQAAAAPSFDEFCASIRALPLQDVEATRNAIRETKIVRSYKDSDDNGRLPKDIERALAPYRLSPALAAEFVEMQDMSEYDYTIFRSADESVFNFMSVEGSARCPSDLWAFQDKGVLDTPPLGPDLGDDCGVARTVGALHGESVLIQHAFGAGTEGSAPWDAGPVVEVRAIRMTPETLTDVCVIPVP